MAEQNLTVGILAHVDAGKTTLSECILYNSGVIRSMGRVDKGDSFFDTDRMERERGITIFSKQAVFELPFFSDKTGLKNGPQADGTLTVTLMDTPGHADFSPEAERILWVLDCAVLVISAADGAGGRSRTLFELLDRYGVPAFVFVNKMDQPGADRALLMEELKRELDPGCVDFSPSRGEAFYEDIALADSDESVMEEYLSTGAVSEKYIRELILGRKIYPVFFGSALKNEGVDSLMEAIVRFASVSDDKTAAVTKTSGKPQGSGEFSAKVFKISRDEAGNRLTHLKVTAGSLSIREPLGDDEKITGIRIYSGEKYKTVNDMSVGGVYAVTGPVGTYGGQGIGSQEDAGPGCFGAVMTYCLNPPDGVDSQEMMKKVLELSQFMPELSATWDEELGEIHVSIMGDVQLEILTRMIKDRYDIDVTFGHGRIIYKETIANIVEGVGHFEPLRHYAEVHLKLEPGQKGSGITVGVDVSVDELALNWIRLIETHIFEREHRGVLTGSVLTDVKLTIVGGRAHNKHTMGGDFRQATYRAIRQGLMQAKSVLLEPWYRFALRVPADCVGRAMTDMDMKGAALNPPVMEASGFTLITGTVPASEVRDYPRQLAAYSSGRGTIDLSFSGYDICHNAEEVINAAGYQPELDLRNTPDSVFCSHGAGTVIPWDEVFDHMHVEAKLSFDEDGEYRGKILVDEAERLIKAGERARSEYISRKLSGNGQTFIGYEEVDEIVARAASSNVKSSKREGEAGWKRIGKNRGESSRADQGMKKRQYGEKKQGRFMLIDGYNLIFSMAELKSLAEENIDSARIRLLELVSNYRGLTDSEILVVFDAYRVRRAKADQERWGNLYVVFTPQAMSADAYIEKYAHENASKYDITVVTSDGLEQVIIRGAGCSLLSARDFEAEMARLNRTVREEHTESAVRRGNSFFDNLSDSGRKALEEAGRDGE